MKDNEVEALASLTELCTRASEAGTRLATLEAELKTVMDREAATIARYDAKLDALEAELAKRDDMIRQLGENAATAAREYADTLAQLRADNAALVEGAYKCALIVDRNLYRQHEKVEDVPRILRALIAKHGGTSND